MVLCISVSIPEELKASGIETTKLTLAPVKVPVEGHHLVPQHTRDPRQANSSRGP
jgi:hypothetical protein